MTKLYIYLYIISITVNYTVIYYLNELYSFANTKLI